MIIISARDKFNHPERPLDRGHLIKEIDLTDDSVMREFTYEELVTEIQNKKILILIHGYNNEPEEVYDAYSIIESKIHENIGDQYDLVIGYSWPGGDEKIDWWKAKRRANSIARRFRFLLEKLSRETASIDLMSHSLGARVALKALKESPTENLVRNYFSAAPAVDNESLEKGEEFDPAVPSCERLFVFHSAKDLVLRVAYRIFQLDNPLGLYGPEDSGYIQNQTESIFVVNCKHKIGNHGGYKRSHAFYQYIAESLENTTAKFVTI